MKTFLSIILIFTVAASTLHAQTYQTFLCNGSVVTSPIRQVDIPVLAGEILEVVGWVGGNGATLTVGVVEYNLGGGEGLRTRYLRGR